MPDKYKVLFLPQNKTGFFEKGTSLWQAALELGIHSIQADCGGLGKCGKCLVTVKKGELSGTEQERNILDTEKNNKIRLACQAQIMSDVVVEIPLEDETSGQVILADGETSFTDLDPAVVKTFVTLEKPQLEMNPFDLEELKDKVRFSSVALQVLQNLPETLRQADYKITTTCYADKLIDIEPGDSCDTRYGIAVDIGTTTIVAKLVDLNSGDIVSVASQLNAQRQFGEDVVSRISYASEQKNGIHKIQKTIIDQLNRLIDQLLQPHSLKPDRIYELTIAGNSTMEHLLLGILPKYMAEYPYVPVFRGPIELAAAEIGIKINPNAMIYLLPNIGRFVGGDTVAVLLTLAKRYQGTWLMIDIGTNGELVLFHKGEMIACSTAAGPALEGAHISCGMRATTGAIDHIDLNGDDLILHVIGESKARGICGSGIIDAIATSLKAGFIDQTGRILDSNEWREDIAEPLRERILTYDNSKQIQFSDDCTMNQKDIREVQLAKSAIASGIQILLKQYQLSTDDLDAIYLAGAFGQYIRPEMAQKIGLLPDIDLQKIHFIGNAAYAGAELALCNRSFKQLAQELVEKVKYIEISTDMEFQTLFAENMLF
ncbi:DUF4445 domain-containing protein [candidate division KSB1 bacterium]|nr:DUF4445 domain-containing protein [candidate division KSB1 bacterium]